MSTTDADIEAAYKDVSAKILHILTIYPIISPTMLQGGLGPSLKPSIWRPVLNRLMEEGKVIEETEGLMTPGKRHNSYTKYSLPGVQVSVRVPKQDA